MNATWVVTGSSRGVGLEIVKQLAKDRNNLIVATCRDPSSAAKLHSVINSTKATIHTTPLNVTEPESIANAAVEVKRLIGERRVDYLINNAAVSSGAVTALTATAENFHADMTSNVLGPMLTAQAFLPLLERVSSTRTPPVVVNITSGLGSLALSTGKPREAVYSMTKSALNMLTCKQAAEKRDIIWLGLNPGWTKTDMGGPNAPLEVEDSVAGMLNVILAATQKDSGSCRRYDGTTIPW